MEFLDIIIQVISPFLALAIITSIVVFFIYVFFRILKFGITYVRNQ